MPSACISKIPELVCAKLPATSSEPVISAPPPSGLSVPALVSVPLPTSMVPVPVIKPWLVKPVFRLNVALPGMLMMPDDVLANGACTSIVPVSTLMVP